MENWSIHLNYLGSGTPSYHNYAPKKKNIIKKSFFLFFLMNKNEEKKKYEAIGPSCTRMTTYNLLENLKQ